MGMFLWGFAAGTAVTLIIVIRAYCDDMAKACDVLRRQQNLIESLVESREKSDPADWWRDN